MESMGTMRARRHAGQQPRWTPSDDFDERVAVLSAVTGGLFWGLADAWAAMEALRFRCDADAMWGGELAELWHLYVTQRQQAVDAIGRRGLRWGAFRHVRHALNARLKLQRTGDPTLDFVEAWQEEVETRIASW